MHTVTVENRTILRDLGDGLVLRRTTPADTEALVAFNGWIHGNLEQEKPDERVGTWTRDLMAKPHPTCDAGDFTIVVDTNSKEIVSTLNSISQTWSHELDGKSPKNVNRSEVRLIETSQGEPAGYLAHPTSNWGPTLPVIAYELKEGISWLAPTYSVIRYLEETGKAYGANGERDFGAFAFWLGAEHPVYQVIPDRLPRLRKPYAWYLRLPDLPDFIRHIIPVLENRLENSPMAGHSGELKITFYQDGLRLKFDQGRLVEVDAWKPVPMGHSGDAAFPGLTFLQLLFGYRDVEELGYAFADCRTDNDAARALLDALFPKQASNLWPVA